MSIIYECFICGKYECGHTIEQQRTAMHIEQERIDEAIRLSNIEKEKKKEEMRQIGISLKKSVEKIKSERGKNG